MPKLGAVFPSPPGKDPLVALQLVLPMGWKNSPPAFCTAVQTIAADIASQSLKDLFQNLPHHPLLGA
jgi:hypothetical protein